MIKIIEPYKTEMTNQELSNSNFILAGFGYGVDANRDKMLNLWTNSRDRTQTRQKTIRMSCILAANKHTVIND